MLVWVCPIIGSLTDVFCLVIAVRSFVLVPTQ